MIKDQSWPIFSIITQSSFCHCKNKTKFYQKCPVIFSILLCVYWVNHRLNERTEDSMEPPACKSWNTGLLLREGDSDSSQTRDRSWHHGGFLSIVLFLKGTHGCCSRERLQSYPMSLFPDLVEELSPLPAREPPPWPPLGNQISQFLCCGAVVHVLTNGMWAKLLHSTSPSWVYKKLSVTPFSFFIMEVGTQKRFKAHFTCVSHTSHRATHVPSGVER